MEMLVKYRLENIQQGLLHDPVANRRDAKQPYAACQLWCLNPQHRLGR